MTRGRWNGPRTRKRADDRGGGESVGAPGLRRTERRDHGGRRLQGPHQRTGEEWYDCRGWAKAHPGGERWLHFFNGRDATDVFYALHSYGPNGSDLAVKRLQKLPGATAKDKSRLPVKALTR